MKVDETTAERIGYEEPREVSTFGCKKCGKVFIDFIRHANPLVYELPLVSICAVGFIGELPREDQVKVWIACSSLIGALRFIRKIVD